MILQKFGLIHIWHKVLQHKAIMVVPAKYAYVYTNKSKFFCQATDMPCLFHVPFAFLFVLN